MKRILISEGAESPLLIVQYDDESSANDPMLGVTLPRLSEVSTRVLEMDSSHSLPRGDACGNHSKGFDPCSLSHSKSDGSVTQWTVEQESEKNVKIEEAGKVDNCQTFNKTCKEILMIDGDGFCKQSENTKPPPLNKTMAKESTSRIAPLTTLNRTNWVKSEDSSMSDKADLTPQDCRGRKSSDTGSVYHDCKSIASYNQSNDYSASDDHMEQDISNSNFKNPYPKPLQHVKSFSGSSICTCPTQSTLTDFCRICHCEGDAELGPLIAPCHCRGSLRYVHQACLQQWIKSSDSKHCELCGYHFVMDSKLKPFHKWKKLSMSTAERRKIMCSVMFHIIAITCVIWSLYVLIERTANEIKVGKLQWPFWTKLVVVAIGFTGGLVFMYVQCKVYVQLWKRLKAYNRVIYVKNNSPSGSNTPEEPGPADATSVRSLSGMNGISSHQSNNVVVIECEEPRNRL